MPNCTNHIPHPRIVEYSYRAHFEIEIRLVDDIDRLCLGNTVLLEPELATLERNATI